MRALIIIPASDLDRANDLAKQAFDPVAGEQTFTNGLAENSSGPATHYWCSAEFTPEKWLILQQVLPQFPSATVVEYDLNIQPKVPDEAITQLGLVRVQTQEE